jgi:tripeptide aminopeptidase
LIKKEGIMEKGMAHIISGLDDIEERVRDLREIILANLVMLSEIPAPTFSEAARMEFLVNRFTELQLLNCSTDEVGNGLGIIPGETGDRNILIVGHMDTVFDTKVDHTITVEPRRIIGPGVGDNGLGLAVIATLPLVLQHLNIKPKSNIILMGSAQSLGMGNIRGLRFFLDHTDLPINAGICVEGVKLGRISYSSIGMMRCGISFSVPEQYDWTRFGAVGAIVTINDAINRILEIPLPKRPKTNIVLGSITGGTGFNTIATQASLKFEIRSESNRMVKNIGQKTEYIAHEVASHSGADVDFRIYAQRRTGGISFSHPMARTTREIMKSLDILPRITPSTSELSAFIDKRIPAVTLGLTNGENLNQINESIDIEPVFKGIAQLLGLILAIDGGHCDEPK